MEVRVVEREKRVIYPARGRGVGSFVVISELRLIHSLSSVGPNDNGAVD